MSVVATSQKYDPDMLAHRLAEMAAQAHRMPPSWRHGDQIPVLGMSRVGDIADVRVATALPGKGIVLSHDLKAFGITKKIPHVYERTPMMRLLELLGSEEAAITTWDGVLAARGAGKDNDFPVSKPSLTTVASAWSSLRSLAGNPAALTYSNIPGGAAPDHTTTGALSWGLTVPGGSDSKYLLTFGFQAAQQINYAWLVDLLVGAGNILATVNTSQTVSTTALTRYTTGIGVQWTLEVTTAIGTTASNVTLTYTNTTPTGSRSSGAIAMTVSSIVGRLLPIALGSMGALQSGDVGITSVQSIQLSAAMSAGVMALNLYKPLIFMPGIAAQVYLEKASTTQFQNFLNLPLTGGGNLGCFQMYFLPNTTSTGIVNLTFCSVAG